MEALSLSHISSWIDLIFGGVSCLRVVCDFDEDAIKFLLRNNIKPNQIRMKDLQANEEFEVSDILLDEINGILFSTTGVDELAGIGVRITLFRFGTCNKPTTGGLAEQME